MRISRVFGLAALGLGIGCSSDDSDPSEPPPTTATVQATPQITFEPATTTIAVGGTVTFAFGPVEHNVFFEDDDGNPEPGAPPNIEPPTANASVDRTFTTAGEFEYYCQIHPSMEGQIVVR